MYVFGGLSGALDCGVPDTVRLVRRAGCRFVHGLRRDISTAQTDSCVIWPCTIRPALCCPYPFFRACCVQTFAPGLAGTSVRVRPYAYSTLMVFVLPLRPLMMPPVMMTLSPFSSCITFRLTCSAW